VFIEAKDDGGGGDNWTTGAISRAKFQSNHHHQQINVQFFYRLDALPVAQPTVSKHWRENITFHGLAYAKLTWGLPTLSLTTNSSWLPWGGGCYWREGYWRAEVKNWENQKLHQPIYYAVYVNIMHVCVCAQIVISHDGLHTVTSSLGDFQPSSHVTWPLTAAATSASVEPVIEVQQHLSWEISCGRCTIWGQSVSVFEGTFQVHIKCWR